MEDHAEAQSRRESNESDLPENEITRRIVDCAYKVHTRLGPGLLESVYEVVLAHELKKHGFGVERQVRVSFRYDDIQFDDGFRIDLLVENRVIVEVKSVEVLHKVHSKQLLTYLRLADKRVGLLLNIGASLMKDGIERVVNGLRE